MVVCLPHRVVVGIPVLVCMKAMCAALPGTASEGVAGRGRARSELQLPPRVVNLFVSK